MFFRKNVYFLFAVTVDAGDGKEKVIPYLIETGRSGWNPDVLKDILAEDIAKSSVHDYQNNTVYPATTIKQVRFVKEMTKKEFREHELLEDQGKLTVE